MNYKCMWTVFYSSDKFVKKYGGDHLRNGKHSVNADVLIVRNPFSKLASFYSDKIVGGDVLNLKAGFVSLLSDKFGFDIASTPKNQIADGIPLEKFIDLLDDLFMEDAHLYPQTYCLKWIKPDRVVRMESELPVLAAMFPDMDFSVRKNESGAKTVLNERARAKVLSLYEEDFRQFYPELNTATIRLEIL